MSSDFAGGNPDRFKLKTRVLWVSRDGHQPLNREFRDHDKECCRGSPIGYDFEHLHGGSEVHVHQPFLEDFPPAIFR